VRPRAENLVAMKVLAAKNGPTRRLQELADVEALRRARNASRMSPSEIVATLEQIGTLAPRELRSCPGPRGESFLLLPE